MKDREMEEGMKEGWGKTGVKNSASFRNGTRLKYGERKRKKKKGWKEDGKKEWWDGGGSVKKKKKLRLIKGLKDGRKGEGRGWKKGWRRRVEERMEEESGGKDGRREWKEGWRKKRVEGRMEEEESGGKDGGRKIRLKRGDKGGHEEGRGVNKANELMKESACCRSECDICAGKDHPFCILLKNILK